MVMADRNRAMTSTFVGSAIDGASLTVAERDWLWDGLGTYPARLLNRRLGRTTLSGCGMPIGAPDEPDSKWTPVHDVGGQWRARLATCRQSFCCDRCGPVVQAESRARFLFHFEDHLAAGGSLMHIRLSVPHGPGDDLEVLLAGIRAAYRGLVRTSAWRRVGIVDQVRVLHIRWSPVHGWHVHLHITAFIRPGFDVDMEVATYELQGAWKDRLIRAGFKRTSRRSGLFARMFASALDALYAWRWADGDDDDSDRYHPQGHLDEVHDYETSYEVDHGLDGDDDDSDSWSVWDLARSALAGDARSFRKWEELVAAVSGQRVVVPSRRLDEVWSEREAALVEAAEVEQPEVSEPVALVGNKLVARAVSAGCWDAGLEAGSAGGVLAAAELWSGALACHVLVDIDSRGIPLIWADAIGPPGRGRRAGGSVAVLCDLDDLVRERV